MLEPHVVMVEIGLGKKETTLSSYERRLQWTHLKLRAWCKIRTVLQSFLQPPLEWVSHWEESIGREKKSMENEKFSSFK